jgi:hypothetical protein
VSRMLPRLFTAREEIIFFNFKFFFSIRAIWFYERWYAKSSE